MERDSFLFRKEWCDAASGLRADLRLELLEAIVNYGLTGKTPEGLGEFVGLAFGIAKAVIDRDNEELARKKADQEKAEADRQQHIFDVRSEAGKKSGEARRNRSLEQNRTKRTKRTNVQFVQNDENPPSPSRAHVIGDNNKNISIDKKVDNQKKEKEAHKKETESLPPDKAPALTRDKALEILDYFNRQVREGSSKIPKCLKLSDQRYSHLKQRFGEYGYDRIIEAIDKAFKSDFLSGRKDNRNNWHATFDWLVLPTNFLKVIEGNYDNDKPNNNCKSGNYGNNDSKPDIDPRRGTDATYVSVEDYEKGF